MEFCIMQMAEEFMKTPLLIEIPKNTHIFTYKMVKHKRNLSKIKSMGEMGIFIHD